MEICVHLGDYRAQYVAAQAVYQRCLQCVDGIMSLGPEEGRAQLARRAIEEWRREDARLRDLLVELTRNDRVRIPRKMALGRTQRRSGGNQGTVICAICHQAVPKLRYPEWQFAHNGTISYRGQDFEWRAPATC